MIGFRIHSILLLIVLERMFVNGEEFNLFGEAGQAYAVEVNIGHPPQKLKLIVDTGSTTLAVGAYKLGNGTPYFYSQNSTEIFDSGKQVQAKYSQGMWIGRLVSDFVQFPSLSISEVRCDMALITKSENFFMNGSGWQGLLGLAYLPVGAWGDRVVVESWLDSVDRSLKQPMSFSLKLCGPQSKMNATHYGKFQVIGDQKESNKTQLFRTPILRKRWYEVGIVSIKVISSTKNNNVKSNINATEVQTNYTNEEIVVSDKVIDIDEDLCINLNKEKSIVDSGTTNIRLPNVYFRQVVEDLRNAAQNSNILSDEFWYSGEAACWTEPQEWSLPWLAIDLLSDESDTQYFTLEIPPKNYMRMISPHNSSEDKGSVLVYCYKLGLEAGGKETVLGYTAMEGFDILFNRSAGWISFETTDCGPTTRITGPYNITRSIRKVCKLTRSSTDVAVSIKAAQWALFVVSIVAMGILFYLLAPCVKMMMVRPLPLSQQMSMSQAALVDQELN